MQMFKACNQWASRPVDERFWDLESAQAACHAYFQKRRESTNSFADLRVVADEGELRLVGPRSGIGARFTHHAFGQIVRKIRGPLDWLRSVPATLAAQNVNHGLKHRLNGDDETRNAKILFHADNGDHVVRAFTGEAYSRIWNWEVFERLVPLQDQGWRVPPARPPFGDDLGSMPTRIATPEDIIDWGSGGSMLSVKVGDVIAPAGIYASDHDCFVFMVHPDRHINDGTDAGMHRGFFVWNSEVGPGPGTDRVSFGIQAFMLRHVCGNHIVWGAKSLAEVRVIHAGQEGAALKKAAEKIRVQLLKYADTAASEDEAKVVQAKALTLGDNKEEVLDVLFGKQKIAQKAQLEAAYDLAERNADIDGDPRTAWGFAQGLTRLSQQTPYMDERVRLDRAASKVVEFAF